MPETSALSNLIRGSGSPSALAALPVEGLGELLLRRFFEHTEESVSRQNAINAVCHSLGLVGGERVRAARMLAEGWQALEQAGYICRDPDQARGDWWFLTRSGTAAVTRDLREMLQS